MESTVESFGLGEAEPFILYDTVTRKLKIIVETFYGEVTTGGLRQVKVYGNKLTGMLIRLNIIQSWYSLSIQKDLF